MQNKEYSNFSSINLRYLVSIFSSLIIFSPISVQASGESRIAGLTNALMTNSGESVEDKNAWQSKRRGEVLELFRKNVYGRVPKTQFTVSYRVSSEDRRAMSGKATMRVIQIVVSTTQGSLGFPMVLFLPNSSSAKTGTFLFICNRSKDNIDPTRLKKSQFWPAEEAVDRGYAMAAFFNGDVDPDSSRDIEFRDGIHSLLDVQRAPDSWGTLAAWAWGASRCLDYLESEARVDSSRIAVIGHSRGGKAALWAGAEDSRFSLVIANNSGCGGASLARDMQDGKETIAAINDKFPHWFCANYKLYNGREHLLPLDQHMLIGLIAPRAVAVGSAADDFWANPQGEFLSLYFASGVYRLFGIRGLSDEDNFPSPGSTIDRPGMHYHLRPGRHDLTLEDWEYYFKFADKIWGQ